MGGEARETLKGNERDVPSRLSCSEAADLAAHAGHGPVGEP